MPDLDELTKKHANKDGGGHYRQEGKLGKPWCCERCQAIYDALKELSEAHANSSHQ